MFRGKIITVETKLTCERNYSYNLTPKTPAHACINLNSTESYLCGATTFYTEQALITPITELR
jgi:hypothetical protein